MRLKRLTPQAFDPKLFRTSGHLGNYNENMYRLWTEDLFEVEPGAKPDPRGPREILSGRGLY